MHTHVRARVRARVYMHVSKHPHAQAAGCIGRMSCGRQTDAARRCVPPLCGTFMHGVGVHACPTFAAPRPALLGAQSALTVLEALLENNFTAYQALRTDPDLAPLRGPELDKLLAK